MKITYLFFLLAAVSITGCQSVFLRRDEDGIRQSLLKEKPLGTPMKEVEEWVKTRGWKDVKVSYTRGFFRSARFTKDYATIGVKGITVTLGEYVSPPVGFATTVEASWGFNEKGELIDVWVHKSTDGL